MASEAASVHVPCPSNDGVIRCRDLAAWIANLIEAQGYAHVESAISFEDYEAVASLIGKIILRSDVQIDLNRDLLLGQARTIERPNIYRAGSVEFHSDPQADLVSWYCVEQDEIDGALLLLDTSGVGEHFSAAELAILNQVNLKSFTRDSDTSMEQYTLAPLLTHRDGRYRVFYVPWLICGPDTIESRAALEKFRNYLSHKEATQLVRLRLKQNECIFVDNHRMLHGRDAIAEGSKRHLLRFYLTRPGPGSLS
jgi:hypothetical protein